MAGDVTTEQSSRWRSRQGFTIIELLVVVGVVVLLVALLLPAVMATREAARRAQCANNLHQLGLAISAYDSVYGCMPPGCSSNASMQLRLMPYLEQAVVFDGMNTAVMNPFSSTHENKTVSVIVVRLLMCPSDNPSGIRPTIFGPKATTNYAGSRGLGYRNFTENGAVSCLSSSPIRFGDISDGTSVTAAMSEWVVGPGLIQLRDAAGTIFETPDLLAGPRNLSLFESECRSLNTSSARIADNGKGITWIFSGYINTLYNHNLRPNCASCWSGGLVQEGAYTAGSRHPGGANVLFVDGHTGFVKDSIDESVWRSIGTRNGGEVMVTDF